MDHSAVRRMILRKKTASTRKEHDDDERGGGASPMSPDSLVGRRSPPRKSNNRPNYYYRSASPTATSMGEVRSAKEEFLENISYLWKGTHSYRHGRVMEDHLRIDVVDTVLFEQGAPTVWMFTSRKTGKVLKKRAESVNLNAIVNTFGQRAEQLYWLAHGAGDPEGSQGLEMTQARRARLRRRYRADGEQFVCVARYAVNKQEKLRVEFLRAYQLLDLLESKKRLSSLVSLQSCASVHKSSATYSTTFRLGTNGISISFTTELLTDDKNIAGSKNVGEDRYQDRVARLLSKESSERNVYVHEREVRLKSKMMVLNKELEQRTLQIVRFIEATRPPCIIAGLRAEFICLNNGDYATLTHISDVVFREPIIRKLESLSARSEDSESVGSMFSSRSSDDSALPAAAIAKLATQKRRNSLQSLASVHQHKRPTTPTTTPTTKPPPKMEDDLGATRTRRAVVSILSGPGGHIERSNGRRPEGRCWGQFCDAAKGCRHDSVEEQLKHRRLSKKGLAPPMHKVTLLAILQTAMMGVRVREISSSKAMNGLHAAPVEIESVANPKPASAIDISERYGVSANRLYTGVDVCDVCLTVYQHAEKLRHRWDATTGEEEGEEEEEAALERPEADSSDDDDDDGNAFGFDGDSDDDDDDDISAFGLGIDELERGDSLATRKQRMRQKRNKLIKKNMKKMMKVAQGAGGDDNGGATSRCFFCASEREEKEYVQPGCCVDCDARLLKGLGPTAAANAIQAAQAALAAAAAVGGITVGAAACKSKKSKKSKKNSAKVSFKLSSVRGHQEQGGEEEEEEEDKPQSPVRAQPQNLEAVVGALARHWANEDPLAVHDSSSLSSNNAEEDKLKMKLKKMKKKKKTTQKKQQQKPKTTTMTMMMKPRKLRSLSSLSTSSSSSMSWFSEEDTDTAKTYRVAQLHSKLSSKLDRALADEDEQVLHPPLLALRRKTYIPQQLKQ